MKEIVTIQVGDFANYIGSHFWNFQDELLGLAEDPHGDPLYKNMALDMDVLYRAGETQQGTPTYCPRMVSVGLQGSLGSLSNSGSLYHGIPSSNPSDIITWTGPVSRYAQEPCKKNLFLQSLDEETRGNFTVTGNSAGREEGGTRSQVQDKDLVDSLENGAQYWTDFSKVQYHPRSLYEVHGSWTNLQKFNNYGIGKEILSEGLQAEEMNERLRFFIEECDHIQGIQYMVDDSGGFSSIAAEYLQNIADEYQNIPVLLYAARAPTSYMDVISRNKSISRGLHDAVSFSQLSSHSNLLVPIGLPSLSKSKLSSLLRVEDEKLFHCSAVYAASIHSISIPFRLETLGPSANPVDVIGAMNVGEMVQMLLGARQNTVSTLGVAMPAPSLIVTDEQKQGSILRSLHSLTPDVLEEAEDLHAVESLTIHGTFYSGGHRASVSQVKDSICASYGSSLTTAWFSHLSVALCPLPIPLPFPAIFRRQVGRCGEMLHNQFANANPKGSLDVDSIPMAARLRSSNAVAPYIEKRLESIQRYGLERGSMGTELLRSWGFGREEAEDMREHLTKMVKALNPEPEVSSDSD